MRPAALWLGLLASVVRAGVSLQKQEAAWPKKILRDSDATTVRAVPLEKTFTNLNDENENVHAKVLDVTTIRAVPLEENVEAVKKENRQLTQDGDTTTTVALPDTTATSTTFSTTSAATTGTTEPTASQQQVQYSPYRTIYQSSPVMIRDSMDLVPAGGWHDGATAAQILNVQPLFSLPLVKSPAKGRRLRGRLLRVRRGSAENHPSAATCGGVYKGLYGVIRSPGYPLYYPNRKRCSYDIEVPDNYTIKFTCDYFSVQGGGANCSNDHLLVSPSGDAGFADGVKFCGTDRPMVQTNGSMLAVVFESDDLFRYGGFSCRYRAMQANGIAVIGSFGNSSETTPDSQPGFGHYLSVSQCPTGLGAQVSAGNDGSSTGDGPSHSGVSVYGGLWNGRCGNANSLPPTTARPAESRIVGGYPTEEHQFPWMAAVLKSCDSSYCLICGGSIISEQWILTGAHCMKRIPREKLGVLVGDHDMFSISNDQKFIKVKEKILHPDYYTPTPLNNDIGLLKLENPIVFSKFISPLCLPALGETGFGGSAYGSANTSKLDTAGLDIVGRNATVLGWGMVNDKREYSDSLRGVVVDILDNHECNKLYGIMTETMMCTSGHNGRGTCYGDSGGPAVVKQKDGGFVQVGILSFGALAGCEKGYPSGQVLVHKYIDWIQLETGERFGSNFG